jgi:heptosyltransferase-2
VVVPYEGEHEVKRVLSLLKPVEKEEVGIIPPVLKLEEPDIEKGRRILRTKGIEDGFIAIFPGSKWTTKRWLPEGFAGLINLLKKNGFSPVILGSSEEKELCDRIAKETGVKSLAGETSIEDLISISFHARAIISNDSAPVHIASALDKPVVAIFGPTHPSLGFYPLSKKSAIVQNEELPCRPCSLHGGRSCPEKHFLCMKTISYHQVYSALQSIL